MSHGQTPFFVRLEVLSQTRLINPGEARRQSQKNILLPQAAPPSSFGAGRTFQHYPPVADINVQVRLGPKRTSSPYPTVSSKAPALPIGCEQRKWGLCENLSDLQRRLARSDRGRSRDRGPE